jgi:hypothetical protein
MNRMILVLKRRPEQESALTNFLTDLQDKRSPHFHRWMTPDQFGEQFGPSPAELQSVTSWLAAEGFTAIHPSRGGISIEFSGTAKQVQSAFRITIHKYVAKGEEHWANASDPEVPLALADLVAGVASLNDFHSKPESIVISEAKLAKISRNDSKPEVSFEDGSHALSPGDFKLIYSVSGWNGFGRVPSIAVLSDSNIDAQNVTNFNNTFYLGANAPNIIVNGPDPGPIESEPLLDVSWAVGISPQSTVDLIVSQSTNATDGLDLSEQYAVDNNIADVLTESYGNCEADLGQAEMQFLNSVREQAAAQGMTFIVAAGDNGSAGCDADNQETAAGPLAVSGRASSPYDIAVGGTEFDESLCPGPCWNAYGSPYTSAPEYIPEIAWNDSCIAGNCPSPVNPSILAGSGGASSVFAKPFWQTGFPGVPDDGARDLPDVSFTASPFHDPYLICLVATDCVTSSGGIYFHATGGTSASAPSFAGMIAQLIGGLGSRVGQINQALYSLEQQEIVSNCNGSAGIPPSTCMFHDITVGNNSVPGQPAYGSRSAPYQAGPAYDLATGLGSLSGGSLFYNWSKGTLLPTQATLSISPSGLITNGAALTLTFSVSPILGSGTPTGSVTVAAPDRVGSLVPALLLSNGAGSALANSGYLDTSPVVLRYSGDSNYAPSVSAPVPLNYFNTVNGCTPTYFGASPNPVITSASTASVSINGAAPCLFDIRVGSPNGPLFTTSEGFVLSDQSQTGNWVTDGMMFYMQQHGDTTSQGTMASAMVTLRYSESSCEVASFSAAPNPIVSYTGLGVATITVDAGCPYDIHVGDWNGPLFMSSEGLASGTTGEWLRDGMTFYLVQRDQGTQLDTLTVHVQQVAPPCQIQTFTSTPLSLPIFDWFPGATISVNAACSYDVREGSPSGTLVGSGTGAQNFVAQDAGNGTIFFLQPHGDTNGNDTLSLVTAYESSQKQPVMPFCNGSAKRYCY